MAVYLVIDVHLTGPKLAQQFCKPRNAFPSNGIVQLRQSLVGEIKKMDVLWSHAQQRHGPPRFIFACGDQLLNVNSGDMAVGIAAVGQDNNAHINPSLALERNQAAAAERFIIMMWCDDQRGF